jgi:Domain of unknown function (DUF4105)
MPPTSDAEESPEMRFVRALLVVVAVLAVGWWGLVLAFGPLLPAGARTATAGAWATGMLAVLVFIRPLWRALGFFTAGALVLAILWGNVQPRTDRDWMPDVARLPTAEIDGDHLTVHNVRDFTYRSETDFDERWETRTYDLSTLTGVDLFLSYWGSPAIAHTILSWTFAGAQPLAISIETRKERGESYSTVLGFFKQYELYYVVADERDVIGLRTNHRGEDTYLYHLRTPVSHARALLLDYFAVINELAAHPRFYDALTQNCTTTIRMHQGQTLKTLPPFDWRMIVNGYGDQMLYERGMIDTSLPFDELKRRSRIVERAHVAEGAADFGTRIREGVPVPAPAGDPTGS